VSVFSWRPGRHRVAARLAAWLTVAALALTALLVNPGGAPVADARGPGGGYYDAGDDNGKSGDLLERLWSAVRAPLRWLRQSSRSFQTLMRLLAERSASQASPDVPPPPPVVSKRPPHDSVEAPEEPPRRRSIYGGEAGAGRDKSGTRVKAWHKRASKVRPEAPPFSCRRAGLPVRLGGWYVVQRGDSLWRIAEVHYGYGEAFARLARANSTRVPDADLIQPCQHLYIPRWLCCGFADLTEPETAVASGDDEEDDGRR
jgi:hypothetical protein